MNRRPARGFTFVEVALVLSIASILLRISVPVAYSFLLKARATSVLGDYNAVRAAAFAYVADHSDWPADAPAGVIPNGLQNYLPRDFSFRKPAYTLDWDSWAASPGSGYTGALVSLSVETGDAELGDTLARLLGRSSAWWTDGHRWTLVVQSTLQPEGTALSGF